MPLEEYLASIFETELLENGEKVTFQEGPHFQDSFKRCAEMYPQSMLAKRYQKFIETKSAGIDRPFGTRDYPLVYGNLSGYKHCHLADDALLIYRRDRSTIISEYVATHRELKKRSRLPLLPL